jgi:hypothetical protein
VWRGEEVFKLKERKKERVLCAHDIHNTLTDDSTRNKGVGQKQRSKQKQSTDSVVGDGGKNRRRDTKVLH